MPSDPKLVSIRDNVITTLKGMSQADGYHYDYGEVAEGVASWEAEGDFAKPSVWINWGRMPPDHDLGAEMATSRFRRYDDFAISVVIKAEDGDHLKMAWRVEMDIHTAMLSSGRNRGTVGQQTHDISPEWEAWVEGSRLVGGVLTCHYATRHDHTTGAMASG